MGGGLWVTLSHMRISLSLVSSCGTSECWGRMSGPVLVLGMRENVLSSLQTLRKSATWQHSLGLDSFDSHKSLNLQWELGPIHTPKYCWLSACPKFGHGDLGNMAFATNARINSVTLSRPPLDIIPSNRPRIAYVPPSPSSPSSNKNTAQCSSMTKAGRSTPARSSFLQHTAALTQHLSRIAISTATRHILRRLDFILDRKARKIDL